MSRDSNKHVEAESTINDSYGTTIPATIRHALDDPLEPGDTVRWVINNKENTCVFRRRMNPTVATRSTADSTV